MPTKPPPAGLGPGCVVGVPERHEAPFNKTSFIEVELVAKNCPAKLKEALRNVPQKIDKLVKVELLAPGFNDLTPLKATERTVTPATPAKWKWQLQPKDNGDFDFTLVVSVLDAEGERVDFVNDDLSIDVHVPMTIQSFSQDVRNGAGPWVVLIGGVLAAAVAWWTIRDGRQRAKQQAAATSSPDPGQQQAAATSSPDPGQQQAAATSSPDPGQQQAAATSSPDPGQQQAAATSSPDEQYYSHYPHHRNGVG